MRFLKKFPFKERPDTAVFSCCHVTEGTSPILHVTHDEDGDWQFLCGANHTLEEARLISLKSAYDIDSSIGQLVGLKPGQSADRDDKESQWIIK